MNILMISPFDLVAKRLWGPTIRLHSLAKEMIKEGHDVVLAGPPPFTGERPSLLDGVPIYYFKAPFHRYAYPADGMEQDRRKNNRRFRIPWVVFTRIMEILLIIRKRRIDLIYVNRAFLDTAYPAFVSHLMGRIPIVYDWDDLEGLHGFSTSFRAPLKYQLFETINETVFPRLADATIVASRSLHDFAENIGVPAGRLFYAPSVADSELFNPGCRGKEVRDQYGLAGAKLLLYCGNLMEGNGVKVENVLYTLKLLLEHDPTFCVLMVGDGDLVSSNGKQGKLVLLAEALGVAERVVFTGGIPYAEVPTYIAAADLCLALFPVNLITMTKSPLKVYEYMAMGKPVVARDVGEISQCVVDGQTGILVYSDSPQEYAEKIIKVFSTAGELMRLGNAARALIDERFSWRHSAATVMHACDEIVAERHHGRFQ